MPRKRNPNRDKAFKMYSDAGGNITNQQLSEILEEKITNIRTWKSVDKWDEKLGLEKSKGGAPKGNVNRVTHAGHVDPDKFTKNIRKLLPKITANLMEELNGENYTDKLYRAILLQEANILKAQKVLYVKNKKDHDIVSTKSTMTTSEDAVLFAHEKETKALQSLSVAQTTLARLIQQYEKSINSNWDLVHEEQKLKIEKLKVEIKKLNGENEEKTKGSGVMIKIDIPRGD